MKDVIADIVIKALKGTGVELKKEEIEKFIEIPPSADLGDYALPCFFLSGKLKTPPDDVALLIRENIKEIPKEFEDIQTSGPYLNFFIDRKTFALNLVQEIKSVGEHYGKMSKANRTTMVEFPLPTLTSLFILDI